MEEIPARELTDTEEYNSPDEDEKLPRRTLPKSAKIIGKRKRTPKPRSSNTTTDAQQDKLRRENLLIEEARRISQQSARISLPSVAPNNPFPFGAFSTQTPMSTTTAQDSFSSSLNYASLPYGATTVNPYNGLGSLYGGSRYYRYPGGSRGYYRSGRYRRYAPYSRRRRIAAPGTSKVVLFKDDVDIISNGHYEESEANNIEMVQTRSLYGGEQMAIYTAGTFNTVPDLLTNWEEESGGFNLFEVLSIRYTFVPMKVATDFSDVGKVVIVVDKIGYADENVFSYAELMACPSKKEFSAAKPFSVVFKPALLEQVRVGGDSDSREVLDILNANNEEEEEAMQDRSSNESQVVYRQSYSQKLAIDRNSIKTRFPGIRYGTIHYVSKDAPADVKMQATQRIKVTQTVKVLFKKT